MKQKTSEDILMFLKKSGYKMTRVRISIVEILSQSKHPVSVTDLLKEFASLEIGVNKTTIYRELDFLQQNKITTEVEFGEGKKRYELERRNHHHHLICLKCKKIEDIELKINLKDEQKRLEKKNRFYNP